MDSQLGNQVNRTLQAAIHTLFSQGEMAQLTHGAFDEVSERIHQSDTEEFVVEFPVGYRGDHVPISTKRTYKKEELLERYRFLAHQQLPVNGIFQLVSAIEIMFTLLIKQIVLAFPEKINSKRKIDYKEILTSKNIDELHSRIVDSFVLDLSYQSPKEFASSVKDVISVNLLECPDFHKYVEVKATRDILIHNEGIVNKTYLFKSDSHARASVGELIPLSQPYFLMSYESCLKLIEWLQEEFNNIWPSSEYQIRKAKEQKSFSATVNEGIKGLYG